MIEKENEELQTKVPPLGGGGGFLLHIHSIPQPVSQ